MDMKGLCVYTDGGARGNPGPAGAGAVVYRDGVELEGVHRFLGTATNNVAEYEAVLLGIMLAKKYMHPSEPVQFFLDSELAAKQIAGVYKIKQDHLKILVARVKEEARGMSVSFTHVRREANKRADELANQAMDEGVV